MKSKKDKILESCGLPFNEDWSYTYCWREVEKAIDLTKKEDFDIFEVIMDKVYHSKEDTSQEYAINFWDPDVKRFMKELKSKFKMNIIK